MIWVKLLGLLISLASMVLKIIERRRIKNEVEIEVIKSLLETVDAFLRKAVTARQSVDRTDDAIRRDPDNRDGDSASQGTNPSHSV